MAEVVGTVQLDRRSALGLLAELRSFGNLATSAIAGLL
jgi:hypothetical protein